MPVGLAREFGLAPLGEDDPLDEIPIDEPIPAPVGAVDGSLVETFADGLKGQHLCDVLDATLLAQRAANVRYDREAGPVPWTKYYTRVLENVGWVVPEFSGFGPRSHETRFSLHSALLKLVTSSLQVLAELNGGDRRLTIFGKNSVQNNAGNFRIDSVGRSANDIVSMKLCAFHVETDESVTDVVALKGDSYRLKNRDLGRIPPPPPRTDLTTRRGVRFRPLPEGPLSGVVDSGYSTARVDSCGTAPGSTRRQVARGLM